MLYDKPLWMWAIFIGIVLFLLVLDLGVFNKKDHEIGVKESLKMSAFYMGVALLFGGWVWFELGAEKGEEFLTGFLVEKSLALDNIFIISLVFSFFAIPRLYQHRVLFWGILGVIVLRGIMIALGATLISNFAWVLYVFAVFLMITGVKMLFIKDQAPDFNQHALMKLMRKHMRITDKIDGNRFFVNAPHPKTGKPVWWATPLFAALVLVEFVDLVFAVDSVPAIFALTSDPYIVYTSNIFAILGLRALYFALAAVIHRFEYLKQALALVLIFIGSKIFVADMLGLEKFPASISLGVTIALIAGGIIYSLIKTKGREEVEAK